MLLLFLQSIWMWRCVFLRLGSTHAALLTSIYNTPPGKGYSCGKVSWWEMAYHFCPVLRLHGPFYLLTPGPKDFAILLALVIFFPSFFFLVGGITGPFLHCSIRKISYLGWSGIFSDFKGGSLEKKWNFTSEWSEKSRFRWFWFKERRWTWWTVPYMMNMPYSCSIF